MKDKLEMYQFTRWLIIILDYQEAFDLFSYWLRYRQGRRSEHPVSDPHQAALLSTLRCGGAQLRHQEESLRDDLLEGRGTGNSFTVSFKDLFALTVCSH